MRNTEKERWRNEWCRKKERKKDMDFGYYIKKKERKSPNAKTMNIWKQLLSHVERAIRAWKN